MFGLPIFRHRHVRHRALSRGVAARSHRSLIEPLEQRTLLAGNGLSGAYFDTPDLTGKVLARTDQQVSFDWNTGAPVSGVGSDYTVRWSGRVQARFSEQYRFATLTAGGVRLWIDNKLIIDNWSPHALTVNSGYASLSAGKRYNVRLEYLNTGGAATAKLYWDSKRQTKQIIPKGYLYSSEVDSAPPTTVSNLHATHVTDKTISVA
jgi:hypothetical protein